MIMMVVYHRYLVNVNDDDEPAEVAAMRLVPPLSAWNFQCVDTQMCRLETDNRDPHWGRVTDETWVKQLTALDKPLNPVDKPCSCGCTCYYCEGGHEAGAAVAVFGHASFCVLSGQTLTEDS